MISLLCYFRVGDTTFHKKVSSHPIGRLKTAEGGSMSSAIDVSTRTPEDGHTVYEVSFGFVNVNYPEPSL